MSNSDFKHLCDTILRLNGEVSAISRKYAIESDDSLLETVERNIDGWRQRALKAEEEVSRLTSAHNHQKDMAHLMLREAERSGREAHFFRETLEWLNAWIGDKSESECSAKIQEALAKKFSPL